jgi:hypothetical protein
MHERPRRIDQRQTPNFAVENYIGIRFSNFWWCAETRTADFHGFMEGAIVSSSSTSLAMRIPDFTRSFPFQPGANPPQRAADLQALV